MRLEERHELKRSRRADTRSSGVPRAASAAGYCASVQARASRRSMRCERPREEALHEVQPKLGAGAARDRIERVLGPGDLQ